MKAHFKVKRVQIKLTSKTELSPQEKCTVPLSSQLEPRHTTSWQTWATPLSLNRALTHSTQLKCRTTLGNNLKWQPSACLTTVSQLTRARARWILPRTFCYILQPIRHDKLGCPTSCPLTWLNCSLLRNTISSSKSKPLPSTRLAAAWSSASSRKILQTRVDRATSLPAFFT